MHATQNLISALRSTSACCSQRAKTQDRTEGQGDCTALPLASARRCPHLSPPLLLTEASGSRPPAARAVWWGGLQGKGCGGGVRWPLSRGRCRACCASNIQPAQHSAVPLTASDDIPLPIYQKFCEIPHDVVGAEQPTLRAGDVGKEGVIAMWARRGCARRGLVGFARQRSGGHTAHS